MVTKTKEYWEEISEELNQCRDKIVSYARNLPGRDNINADDYMIVGIIEECGRYEIIADKLREELHRK